MKANLLDVNALVALAWPNHVSHLSAIRWFREHAAEGLATCPMTEAGFVRVSLNPAVVSEPKAVPSVLEILERYRSLPGHRFLSEDLPVAEALRSCPGLMGYRQVTDAYLLALAARKGVRLVTFDRGISTFASKSMLKSLVVIP